MEDLNDLYYFVQIVDHGGFAAAGRAIAVPKSKLSRRLAALEQRLGVRLLHRSTRHLSLTEVGRSYYRHCRAMLVEAESARLVIDQVSAAPRGTLRVACPITLLHVHVGEMLADFMARHPEVTVYLEATNRRVDLIQEGIDLAIRVRQPPLEDSDLVLKVLSERRLGLLASPALLDTNARPEHPDQLRDWPSICLGAPAPQYTWNLQGPDGESVAVRHRPRFVTTDMIALRRAALAGVGVVQLPLLTVRQQLEQGTLVQLLPEWSPPADIIHAVYPSRRGQLPAVRALIDQLAAFYDALEER